MDANTTAITIALIGAISGVSGAIYTAWRQGERDIEAKKIEAIAQSKKDELEKEKFKTEIENVLWERTHKEFDTMGKKISELEQLVESLRGRIRIIEKDKADVEASRDAWRTRALKAEDGEAQ